MRTNHIFACKNQPTKWNSEPNFSNSSWKYGTNIKNATINKRNDFIYLHVSNTFSLEETRRWKCVLTSVWKKTCYSKLLWQTICSLTSYIMKNYICTVKTKAALFLTRRQNVFPNHSERLLFPKHWNCPDQWVSWNTLMVEQYSFLEWKNVCYFH